MSKILESYILVMCGICVLTIMIIISMQLSSLVYVFAPEYSKDFRRESYDSDSKVLQGEIEKSKISKDRVNGFISDRIEKDLKKISNDAKMDVIRSLPLFFTVSAILGFHVCMYRRKVVG